MNSKHGKDYYLNIHKENEFGEDPEGNEWQVLKRGRDARGNE
jgi:hypothetical protein